MAKSRKTEKGLPIAIIGGGPAGLSAAIAAVKKYKNVIVYDKNPEPAKKIKELAYDPFIVAEKLDSDKFEDVYGDKYSFIAPALKSYGWKEITEQLEKMGIKVSNNGKDRFSIEQQDLGRFGEVFKKSAESEGIVYKKSSRVTDLVISRGKVKSVVVNGVTHPVSAVVVACGSFSSPKSGSTKDGYAFAEKAGHEIIPIKPAFVGLETREKYGKFLDGVEVRDCLIRVSLDEELQFVDRGKLRFTGYGLSGEIILNNSAKIIEILEKGEVKIHMDQVPDLSRFEINRFLNQEFPVTDRTTLFQHLNPYLPDGLLGVMDKIIRVHSNRPVAFLSSLEKKHIMLWLKDFPFTIKGARPFNETRGVLGGVALDDIDPKTMRSNKIKNLYFAGEVLDLLGPWGGYNFEMAFSTGRLAGLSAANDNGAGKKK
ncbi:MAG: aminoacetone oxidase family FAD-binding enzyme [Candidatus Zixiibacteriota bacterium]|nr:MAG: aminoacetone oxidase family FAD-binding enzyme [candidate division Zixibacteria bacterium]